MRDCVDTGMYFTIGVLITALFAFSVIPFGPTIELFGQQIDLVVLDMNGGLLFGLAATALGVYALVCAGWASRRCIPSGYWFGKEINCDNFKEITSSCKLEWNSIIIN